MASYYVDATLGDDSNPGTITQPWKTISKVNSSSFNPGDKIYFKRGEIWRERLTVPSSGLDGNPITFGAYGTGDKPKISGADVVTDWSGPDVNGEYYKSGFATGPYVVLRDGSRISKGTVGSLGANEWGYDSGTLYLGFDPSSHTIEAGQRTSPITINGKSYITIENITVYGGNNRADTDAAGGNICIYGASNNIILNYITSYGCHFSGIGIGDSDVSDITISNVTVYDTLGAGIRFASGVTNSTLSNFTVHDCAMLPSDDGAGGNGGGVEIISDCDNISVSSGEVYNTGAGLTSQGADPGVAVYESTNIDITKVKIHDCYGGGAYYRSVTAGHPSSGNFVYNIVCNNGNTSMPSGSILVGLRAQGVTDARVTVNVYNNVFCNNLVDYVGQNDRMGMVYASGETTINFKNNILKDPIGDYSCYMFIRSSVTYVASNNCYHTTGSNNRWSWDFSYKYSLSEWESVSGETNSLNQDPSFVDPDNGDFRLKVGSPCIDAGTNVGLDRDFNYNPVPWGAGVDIGAFELIRRITVLSLSHNSLDCRLNKWTDLSRFHNHGVPHSGVRPCVVAPGIMGYWFDGNSGYVDCGNNKSLDIIDTITIKAWVKVKGWTGSNQLLVSKGSPSAYSLFLANNSNFRFEIRTGSGFQTLDSLVQPVSGRWYHLVGTYNRALPSDNLKVYVNGAFKNSMDNTEGVITNDEPVYVGRHPTGLYFNGTIAEPCIYNRALSADEVRENMYRSPIYRMLRGLPHSMIYTKVPWKQTQGGIYAP
ncbi:MAG: hypothetical protein DRJ03_22210 [Chloroflexi bacterium]|nr:MAG: hypothetical protein DRJ03_22210 [Chloroflexota bacterium]